MKTKSLIAFKYVFTKGSIVAASRYIHLSVSAISRIISQLEDDLQLKLFSRDGQKLRPTYEGKKFYIEVENLLKNMERMDAVVNELKETSKNNLRIISVPRISQFLTSTVIVEFLKDNSNANVKLNVLPHGETENLLAAKEYDIGVGFLPVQHENTVAKPIIRFRFLAILHKSHPLAGLKSISIDQLQDDTFVRLLYGKRLRQRTDEIFDAANIKMDKCIDVSSSLLACSLVAKGVGYTIADEMIAEQFKEDIVMVPITPQKWATIGFLYPDSSPTKTNIQKFETLLVEQIKEKFNNPETIKWIDVSNT